jgi:hypothetical protein
MRSLTPQLSELSFFNGESDQVFKFTAAHRNSLVLQDALRNKEISDRASSKHVSRHQLEQPYKLQDPSTVMVL